MERGSASQKNKLEGMVNTPALRHRLFFYNLGEEVFGILLDFFSDKEL